MKRGILSFPKVDAPWEQRGQALTEFLALAVVLVPLFLLIPLIAKYQDISHQVQMASRYVAFEAMTRNGAQSSWKTPEQLSGEVRRRFFSNSDAPIKTDDVAGNFLGHQNLFWRGPDGNPQHAVGVSVEVFRRTFAIGQRNCRAPFAAVLEWFSALSS